MEITADDIARYQKNFEKVTKYKVMQGVLRKASIIEISANENILSKRPFKFNVNLPENVSATDQQYSGRCWIFAGLNVLRHKLIARYKLPSNFELSEAYIQKWDKLEKCNAAIETIYALALQGKDNMSLEYATMIEHMISDGGTWDMFVKVVKKYGVVPKDVYPDNNQSQHTMRLNAIILNLVLKTSTTIDKSMDRKTFVAFKKKKLEECYRVLNMCLGNTPDNFLWTFKETKIQNYYTPKTFYKQVIKPLVNIETFVSLCNFPLEKYGQILAVEYMHSVLESNLDLKHSMGTKYLNVEIEDMKKAIAKTIEEGTAVWFGCDVGKYFLNRGSLLDKAASNLEDIFDIDFYLPKKQNLETRIVVPNHAMVFTGVQKESATDFKRWKVENSHGGSVGINGFITMSGEWFDDYVISAAVPWKCLPPRLRGRDKKVKWLPYHSVLGILA